MRWDGRARAKQLHHVYTNTSSIDSQIKLLFETNSMGVFKCVLQCNGILTKRNDLLFQISIEAVGAPAW